MYIDSIHYLYTTVFIKRRTLLEWVLQKSYGKTYIFGWVVKFESVNVFKKKKYYYLSIKIIEYTICIVIFVSHLWSLNMILVKIKLQIILFTPNKCSRLYI